MKKDENGVLHSVDENDVVDGVLTIPEGVKRINWNIPFGSRIYRLVKGDHIDEYVEVPNVAELTKKIELPSTLIEIGGTGFRGFEQLERIVMPDSVTKIEKGTFEGCKNLKHINLSRNLESIPDRCFSACESLKVIVIPDSVKNIGMDLFYYCKSLECIYLSKNINVIQDKSLNVTVNGENAALHQHRLKEIVFPQNAHSLFSNSTLKSEVPLVDKAILPDNVHVISNAVETKFVFRTEEAANNFKINNFKTYSRNCTVKDPIIEGNPVGRRRIEMLDVAQKKRNSLTKITIEGTDIIGEYAFAECENLEEVIVGEEVKSIARGAFAFCPKLKRVILPEKLKSIGNDAFRECTSLEEITINSDLDRIGDRAFYDCSTLKTIITSKGKGILGKRGSVGDIGEEAFLGCKNLQIAQLRGKDSTIGKKLTSIGDRAFKNCSKLMFINIPVTTEKIGESAFENCCSEQAYIEIPNVVNDSGKLKDEMRQLPHSPSETLIIPATVKQIGKSAFKGCKNIVFAHFNYECPLENIEESTFEGCENLQAIDLPEKVKTIGDKAFSDCKSLEGIILPEGFEKIGSKSFENCESFCLMLTNSEVKKESDSFFNAKSDREANLNDFYFKSKNIEGKEYEVITSPKKDIGKITVAAIKKASTLRKER
ncbi:MAG: leucine-rich repeat domain-containing protein [Clostridia bacterium]|nr:leucine-rich repeat domain-containing protein [Clostridia bacterium]